MAIITIIGSGMMGSALAFPARENGHTVRLTGTHLDREIIETSIRTGRHPKFEKDFPNGVEYYQIEDLKKVIDGSDLIICGVSSFGVDWFAGTVLPHIPETMPILSVTKGLIDPTGEGDLVSYPAYWASRIAPQKRCLNAVGGPCTSYELVAQDPSVVTFCGDDLNVLNRIKSLMQTPYYHIKVSTDVMGVECSVALKNAYALGVTIAVGYNERLNGIGCKPHYNSQAAAFGQSVKEMSRLLKFLAKSDDALDVGVGDLFVTVFSGRGRLQGTLLGRGATFAEAQKQFAGVTMESSVIVERLALALRTLTKKGKLDIRQFPILAHLGEIILDGKIANLPWNDFVVN
jgi:glycerol-3-phosphate dehydrogenase (NAD(P)+)